MYVFFLSWNTIWNPNVIIHSRWLSHIVAAVADSNRLQATQLPLPFSPRNVEQVLKHWNWYLYCLSFESHDFTSDHNQWNRLPEETLV